MAQMVDFKLCGGTFFSLLSNARKPLLTKEQNYSGQASGLTEPEMLLDLARVVVPELRQPMDTEWRTLKDNTRKFKACINWGGGTFCFGDTSVNTSFDDKVKRRYSEVLAEMSAFIESYLDVRTSTKKDEYLIKALVEVIANDDGIAHDQPFYICKDGSAMTRDEISHATQFYVQPFLLGIWHYVLTGIADNKIGAATYNAWCPPKGRAERVYTAAIGEHSSRAITIRYCNVTTGTDDAEKDVRPSEPTVEAEIIDPIQTPKNDATLTPVKQVVMNNYGSGTQIDTVEGNVTINIPGNAGASNSLGSDYFNLIVGFDPFASDHLLVPLQRALTEYIEDDVQSRFGSLDETTIAQIKQLPTIIVEEFNRSNADSINALFAFITNIRRQQNGIKIYFKSVCKIPARVLQDNLHGLAIDMAFESTRTHWTIKNINLLEALQDAGVQMWGGFAHE